jgi:hypothetical protein
VSLVVYPVVVCVRVCRERVREGGRERERGFGFGG